MAGRPEATGGSPYGRPEAGAHGGDRQLAYKVIVRQLPERVYAIVEGASIQEVEALTGGIVIAIVSMGS